MANLSTRLVIHATLMTLGVILMLLGIGWLIFLGLALIMLAEFFSSQKFSGRSLTAFLFYAVAAVLILVWDCRDGDTFVQKAQPVWFWVVIVAVWIWSIFRDLQKWRNKGLSRDA